MNKLKVGDFVEVIGRESHTSNIKIGDRGYVVDFVDNEVYTIELDTKKDFGWSNPDYKTKGSGLCWSVLGVEFKLVKDKKIKKK